ncbi:MAG: hypothetical protein ACYC1U_02520 [Candidatus Aquicultorales bacterium]
MESAATSKPRLTFIISRVQSRVLNNPLESLFVIVLLVFGLTVLLAFGLSDLWTYYPDHNDFDITNFGTSILAGHYNPHWYGYGYLTFIFSAFNTLVAYIWHVLFLGRVSLHDFLVQSILAPQETLLFNRIGFFGALCAGVALAGYYIKTKTNVIYGLIFVAGITLTTSFQSLKYYLKSQSIDVLWVVLSLFVAEKLFSEINKRNLTIAGIILGLAWATSVSNLLLVFSFLITTTVYLFLRYRQGQSDLKCAFLHFANLVGAFLATYFLVSPYALIEFVSWVGYLSSFIMQGGVSGFTWDSPPSLLKTLEYIGYNTITFSIVMVALFIGFILWELKARSLRFLHPILFLSLSLLVYSRSPHIRDYYLWPFIIVLNILVIIMVFRLGNKFGRWARVFPLVLVFLVGAAHYDARILRTLQHSFSSNRKPANTAEEKWGSVVLVDYNRDGRIAAKQWINKNIKQDSLLILDGWPHFLPPVVTTEEVISSSLWGYHRYGREFNDTIQSMVAEARLDAINQGQRTYDCRLTQFSYEYEKTKVERVQELVRAQEGRPVYYIVSFEWYNQFLGAGMRLQKKQKAFVTYYDSLINGRFGPVIYRNDQVLIIRVDKEAYGS